MKDGVLRLSDFYPLIFPLRAMEAAEVPASPPTEMVEMSEENGSAPEVPVYPEPDSYSMPRAVEDDEGELPADFDRLWKAAHTNPPDFTCWTDLLQYCEQEVGLTETDLLTLR